MKVTNKQETKPFPKPIPIKKLIGPSFIILALGLGSGEVILWPYMASNYGLGIAWGAVLGISFQYIINMEIERYALVKGESVFVGMAKLWNRVPYWFILSTFIGFGLPGIIAASATVFASLVGVAAYAHWIAIVFLLAVGLILSSGRTVYGLMEKLTRTIILIGVPFVFLLTLMLAAKTDWAVLAAGIVGQGDGYMFFPEGIVLATFLAAFAYSGAGGNLNLTQSIYVKEKGYGMGKYAQRLSGLFKSKAKEEVRLDGHTFDNTPEARKRFNVWWLRMSIEHALVFWFIGVVSILLLMLLAYTTTFGLGGNGEGINFVIMESQVIGSILGPAIGASFLFVVAVMLFQTQLGVMDSTSRIMAENAAIKYMEKKHEKTVPLSMIYYIFLWSQIAFGITLFLLGISEPKALLVLGAVINAVAMFVHIGLVSVLNFKSLPKYYQPSVLRRLLIAGIFIFFGFFSTVVLWDKLF